MIHHSASMQPCYQRQTSAVLPSFQLQESRTQSGLYLLWNFLFKGETVRMIFSECLMLSEKQSPSTDSQDKHSKLGFICEDLDSSWIISTGLVWDDIPNLLSFLPSSRKGVGQESYRKIINFVHAGVPTLQYLMSKQSLNPLDLLLWRWLHFQSLFCWINCTLFAWFTNGSSVFTNCLAGLKFLFGYSPWKWKG